MKGSGTNVSIDYNKALVTRGSLVPALDATVTVNESKVTFAWTDNSGMGDAISGFKNLFLLAGESYAYVDVAP